MNSASSQRDPVEKLAEEYLERLRKGEQPDVGEYAARYPDLAAQIHDLFPMLGMMEDVRPGTNVGSATVDGHDSTMAKAKLERLGEYRILREVGHGGMGIVYEAEQESLGRHVALKVLMTNALLDPKQLQRFHREARAAARLHHTNIVPVHGVGHHDGMHFYIMQFIQGQGLDQVLEELKRLDGLQRHDGPSLLAESREPVTGRSVNRASRAGAEALLTGSFNATAIAAPPNKEEGAGASESARGVIVEGSEPRRAQTPIAEPGAPNGTSSSGSIHLPGQAQHSALSHSSSQYSLSVARIGTQVADALAYAHSQGILHRDIKPSNLLLDAHGTVWVTDFGLAKASADHENLTHTGDIVGTLRYMAPERFQGHADVRSDLYSLGLTLYELLALRPAFDEHDRNKLIQQVIHEEPTRLRKLNPAVPRDLETIILKAIARDPALRYQTPQALAEDLTRFLEDRPIMARRANLHERFWRWCRRNPVVAGLGAAAQIALVALLVVGAWSHKRISYALEEKEQALGEKVRALGDKDLALAEREAARREALQMRDDAVTQTYRALMSETQALRLAHNEGWRFKALQNLKNLAQMDSPKRDLVALRSEAMACLGEFDAKEVSRLIGHTASIWSLDFSADGSLLATAGYDGRLQIWNVLEGRQVREVIDSAFDPAKRGFDDDPLPAVRFRPGTKELVFARWPSGVRMLDLAGDRSAPLDHPFRAPGRYLAFDKKGETLVISGSNWVVELYDAASRTLKRSIRTAGPAKIGNWYLPVAINPEGTLLAATSPQENVQLHTIADAERMVTLGKHAKRIRSLAFSPSGKLLASASEDTLVKLWDITGASEPRTLTGHEARVNCVAFSPDGSLLASASDDHSARIWDTRTGQTLMVLNPRAGALLSAAFSPDGSRLAVGSGAACIVYQLTSRREQQRLAGHDYLVNTLAFHSQKPILASGSSDRSVILWDVRTGLLQNRWQSSRRNPIQKLALSPAGDTMAVGYGSFATPSGKDFSIDLVDLVTKTRLGTLVGPQGTIRSLAFARTGKRLVAATSSGMSFVWDLDTDKRQQAPGNGADFLGQGSQWILTNNDGRISIRDLDNQRTLQQATLGRGLVSLAIAPDEKYAAVAWTSGALRIVGLPRLETTVTLQEAHKGAARIVAFSPDGRLLASYGDDRRVVIRNARTLEEWCSLPQTADVNDLTFSPDSQRLAICGVEESITLWNFALVRPGLAAVGLDWDGPLPQKYGTLAELQSPPGVKQVRVVLRPIVAAKVNKTPKASFDVRRAVFDLYANPFNPDAHLRLGVAMVELGKLEPGHAHMMVALGLRPKVTAQNLPLVRKALQDTGEMYVSQYRWQDAANDFVHLAKWAPQDTLLSVKTAALLLMSKDQEAHRRLALDLLVRHGETSSILTAERTVKVCLFGKPAPESQEKLAALARLSVENGPDSPWLAASMFVRGLSEYRQGRYVSALEWFERARAGKAAPHVTVDVLNQLFNAMTLYQLDRKVEAAKMFAPVQPLIEQGFNAEVLRPNGFWHDWLYCQLALEEAEMVLKIN